MMALPRTPLHDHEKKEEDNEDNRIDETMLPPG
jgi:hypothetical protein